MGLIRTHQSSHEFVTQPVILRIQLGGKPKWLPLKFGYHDVMHTGPITDNPAPFSTGIVARSDWLHHSTVHAQLVVTYGTFAIS